MLAISGLLRDRIYTKFVYHRDFTQNQLGKLPRPPGLTGRYSSAEY